jgi:hypothetical protein
MKMKNLNFKPVFLLLLGLALITYVSCTAVEDNTRSSELLTVSNVIGQPGSTGEDSGTPLLSDVCDNPNTDSQDPDTCSVFNDNADVTLDNDFLQIGKGSGVGPPSFINDILVTQYRIDYVRPNGRNTPGVDVPFGIDGTMDIRVAVNSNSTASVLVVRHQAKREPPLSEITTGEGEGVITANAQMQFFGHDLAGRTVNTTGFLEIHWANYAEP